MLIEGTERLTETVTLHLGDCVAVLATLEANSIDAIVTDPPYGLEFMGKEWDAPWKYGMHAYGMTDTKGRAAGPSFSSARNPMCKVCHKHKRGSKNHKPCVCEAPQFDDIDHRLQDMMAFQAWCHAWAQQVYRVLKPGAHALIFGGARTYHRMVCAVEDAGFEIRDQVQWLYGSGFPKSLNVSKAIDKAARGVPQGGSDPTSPNHGKFKGGCSDDNPSGRGFGAGPGQFMREAGDTVERELAADALAWSGYGTALKPACEPIVLARKPLIGTVAENVQKHGTGALNIDACRVEGEPQETRFDPAKHSHDGWRMNATGAECYARAMGREGEASAERRYTDEGSTNFAAKPGKRRGRPLRDARNFRNLSSNGIYGDGLNGSRAIGETTQGRWPANVIHDGSDEVVSAFPDSAGQQGDVRGTEPSHTGDENTACYGEYGRVAFGKRNDAGSATRFFYTAKADSQDRLGSKHPTVKPVDLMAYLIRLVTPKGGTVLDPFAGTGTTGEAAFREGVRAILIEREPEYQEDIRRRMRLATTAGPDERAREAMKARMKDKPADHGPLFGTMTATGGQ